MALHNIQTLYEQLLHAFDGKPNLLACNCCHFVSMKGTEYDSQSVKLLLVGRAPNGWKNLPIDSPEDFGTAALKEFDKIGFTWVVEKVNGHLYSGDKGKYCLDKSPFWAYTHLIFNRLTEQKHIGKWIEKIASTDLYKMAPMGKNPEKKSIEIQIPVSIEILRYEIQHYLPTHILFVTGAEWFKPFSTICDSFEFLGNNVSRGKNKNNIYVEGKGRIGRAKVVVTCRPEYRPKDDFVNAVVESFKN